MGEDSTNGVKIKCVNTNYWTGNGVGGLLCKNWRWRTKA